MVNDELIAIILGAITVLSLFFLALRQLNERLARWVTIVFAILIACLIWRWG